MSTSTIVSYALYRNASACPNALRRFAQDLAAKGGGVLGVDVGVKHVGLALSNNTNSQVLFQTSFQRQNPTKDVSHIKRIACKGDAKCAIVGMPISPYEDYSSIENFIHVYAEKILHASGIEIIGFWDESFTSAIAKDAFYKVAKKKHRSNPAVSKRASDSGAAAIILRDALDAMRFATDPEQQRFISISDPS